MTGRDDGGLGPHPGDPWYSEPSDDAEIASESDAKAIDGDTDSGLAPRKKKQKKEKRRGRRDRRERESALPDDAHNIAADFDPTTTAFDAAQEPVGGQPPLEKDDPFEAVLEREGRVSRHQAAENTDVPPPAWTVDQAPDPDQVLPVEQPSWIGQTTGGVSGVETLGFEPTEMESEDEEVVADGAVDSAPDARVEIEAGSDSEADSFAPAGTEEVAVEPTDPPSADVGPVIDAADEGELVGEYGVAGPEAFGVLETDDATTDELEDWDAFVEGSSQTPSRVEHPQDHDIEITADPSLSKSVDDWVEPEPKKRRGFFGRGRSDLEEEAIEDDGAIGDDGAIDDGFVGVFGSDELLTEEPGVAQPRPDEAAELPEGGEAFGDWIESEPKRRRGLFGRGRSDQTDDAIEDDGVIEDLDAVEFSDISVQEATEAPIDRNAEQRDLPESLAAESTQTDPEIVVLDDTGDEMAPEGVAAAVAEALEVLEAGPVVGWDDSPEDTEIAEPAAVDVVDEVPVPVSDRAEQQDLFEQFPESLSGEEAESPDSFDSEESDRSASIDPVAQEPIDPVVEETSDWEGDAGRVPAGWFAGIDEDEVVPPPVADTPETEWPVSPEGSPGEQEVEATDLFDIEEPESAPQPQLDPIPDQTVAIPEGYEQWQEAVLDAVELGADVESRLDDGTYEYEPLVQDLSPTADELPDGFEPFPGSAQVEQFDLPEQTMREEMTPIEFEKGWLTDDADVTQVIDEGMDVPFPVGSAELEEQIYAGAGTIEHRDLAAAIAEGSQDDTQWQALSVAIPGVETGVLGFEDVADLGTGGEYVAPARSDLGTRVATGVVLVAMLFGSLYLSGAAFAGFIGLVVMLGLVEFYGSLRRSGYLPLTLFGLGGGLGVLVATWFHGPLAIPAGVLLTSTVTFFFYAFSQTRRDALSNAGLTVLGVGWVIATAALAIPIARAEDHVVLIFAIVAVTAATDVGAFSFGRMWGKNLLAPILSPNKTTEGLVGGVLLAMAVAGAIGYFELGPFDLTSGLALGGIVAFLAPIGDLSESMIKRSLGIKDMGSILPGHGGVLDRIDAFLFVIPAAWVFYETIGYLG